MVRVFANGPGDLGSIPGGVIPKTQKIELDASSLNTHHYKVRIKSKVGQSWCSKLLKREPSGHPSTTITNFTYYLLYVTVCKL